MKFFKEIVFIFIVALFFAGLTAGVNQALNRRIQLNDQTRISRQLLDVLDIKYPKGAAPNIIKDIEQKRTAEAQINGMTVYRKYDLNGKPSGYGFEIGGKGFWGGMKGLLAMKNDLNTITGIIFTSQNETPGLGARVDEPWFRDQFKGIKLSDAPKRGPYITIASDSNKKNSVDAITGATMTSKAVEKFLNKDLRQIVSMKDDIRRIDWPSHLKR